MYIHIHTYILLYIYIFDFYKDHPNEHNLKFCKKSTLLGTTYEYKKKYTILFIRWASI